MGSDGASADILGIEVTPTVVRAIRLNRDDRKVIRGAECPVLTIGDPVALDPSAIGPALDEVMYQLDVDDRAEHLAAVAIGPRRAGVGSGPALTAWLDHRARQLGENMVCAGKLGISFCPQRALDTAIMICEQANITVSRIDFAPVAAARMLRSGTEIITLGSGRGWRARLRDDEVLEAVDASDVSFDDPLMVVTDDEVADPIDVLNGVSLASEAKSSVGARPGRFAVAVGAAIGVIDGSSGNLLDGDIVRGRQVPTAFAAEVGGVNTGEIAGSRTTVSLARGQAESQARSVIRQTGTVLESPGDTGAGFDADDNVEAEGENGEEVAGGAESSGGMIGTEVTESDSGTDAAAGPDAAPTGAGRDVDAAAGIDVDSVGDVDMDVVADSEAVGFGEPSVGTAAQDDSARGAWAGAGESGRGDVGVGDVFDTGQGVFSDVTEGSESRSILGFQFDSDPDFEPTYRLGIHPDDPIHSFSPEPGAEHTIDRRGRGRGLALVVAGLILFSLAIAVGILVTQG
ncbi:MAG: hypothetical protein OER95_09765 [Acidimicrobiia bacterium]|nr:hypothetical protein [Acidimicrobiia bacterium]